MSDNKRNSNAAGKGYYIALILCAFAIGITSYVYYRNDKELEKASLQETQEELIVGTMAAEDIPVLATQPPATKPSSTQPPAAATVPPTQPRSLKTAAPVSGEAITEYAMEALSYNQTTRDWRVHNGVDYAAEPGTAVCAAADGTVYTVYEDDAMGSTVVIRHTGGYTTKYSSLSQDVAVKPGDEVTVGQTIGYAGDTALVETTLGTHVHFSVTAQDEPMDPMEFLSLGQ